MTNWKLLAAVATLLVVMIWTQAPAQRGEQKKDDAQAAPVKEAKKGPTHKVEKKPFKIELAIKGVLEGETAEEIIFRSAVQAGLPVSPGPLTVRLAVKHGTTVKVGDLLVEFDTRKMDQAIAQLETDSKVLAANIKLSEEEQHLLEKAVPMDLEGAERAKREADEDLAYFLKVGRPEAEKRAHNYVKFAAFYLEYAKEQLRQLEKMYKANDLTEDTEQIILKRQRFSVENAINDFRLAELDLEHTLKTVLPRNELRLREGAARQSLILEKARATSMPLLGQKQKMLAKLRFDYERLATGLEQLRKDRQAMTIRAKAAGVVYYGKFSAGQWENAATLATKLVPNGTVQAEEVIMTLVKARPLLLRVAIEEKDASLVKAGLTGKTKAVAKPEAKLSARVTSVSAVPSAPGKYEAQLAVENKDAAEVVPGMACAVQLVAYTKKQALVVPASAVFEEDDQHFVEVVKDGQTKQRPVTVGHTHDGKTEILTGLNEGEEILLERSAAKKTEPTKGGSES